MIIEIPSAGPTTGSTYRVSDEIMAIGDHCDIYEGSYERNGKVHPAVFKRARNNADLDRLDHERKVLNTFWKAIDEDKNLKFFGHTLPKHFGRASDGVLDFHVLKKSEGYTAETLRALFPNGVPPNQVAWMLTRLLTTLAAAHQQGWTHGAVLPQHLLVRWDNVEGHHFAKVLDWTSAARIDDPIQDILPKYALFYAPEAWKKGKASPASDIFMFGQVANYLLGGDLKNRRVPDSVPRQLRGFVQACLIPSLHRRPDNASELLLDNLRPVLAEIWGSPKFVDFQLPEQASA